MTFDQLGVLIYGKSNCKNCDLAKEFCKTYSIPYNYIELDPKSDSYDTYIDELLKTGHSQFPFIYVSSTFLGGYSQLVNAYDTLKLHALLQEIGVDLPVEF